MSSATSLDTDKFIEELKGRSAIWSPEADTFDRAVAWNEMSKIFGLNVYVLKQKWKHLRDIFRREYVRNSMRRGRSIKSPEDFTGKWQYFSRLWDICESTRLTCNIENKLSTNEEDDPDQEDEANDSQESSESEAEVIESEPEVPRAKKQKRVKKENMTPLPYDLQALGENCSDDLREKQKEVNQEQNKLENTDDYDFMYLKSLLPFFRMLPPVRKLYVRNVFQELLYKELQAVENTKEKK